MNPSGASTLVRAAVSGLVTMAALVAATVATAAEPRSFYVDYSASVPAAPLRAHPLAIVHPDARVDLSVAHRAGNAVLAYLSVGEVAPDAPYRAEVLQQGLPFAGRNPAWNSDLIDLADPRWTEYLVDRLAARIAARGFDGFFLDTADAVELGPPADTPRGRANRAALVALVRRLRSTFPDKQIVLNRGFFAFDAVRDSIDGVLAESVFETVDHATGAGRSVAPAETAAVLAELARVAAAGKRVYVLDYTAPDDVARADSAAARIRQLGYHAFVSTPALDGRALAPLRLVPRRICAFYGNLTAVQEDQIKWPAESFVGLRLQLPLEWLGYEVDYHRLLTAGDLPVLDEECRAIVLPRGWEIPPSVEPALVDWLIAQRAAGRKILLLGRPPFSDPVQLRRFLGAFGFGGSGAILNPPFEVEVTTRQPGLIDHEAPVRALPVDFRDLRAPAGARVALSLRARPERGAPVDFDAVFTCDWGGVALEPYLFFRRADFREFWHLDPFAFLVQALGELDAPVPDTTTREGRRILMSHIDGDGFSNFSRAEPGRRSAEVIRDRILRKYPFPVTVSVIEAEIRGLVRTQRPDAAPELEALARDILRLPHVEAASHSFSHPFYWIENDRTEALYDQQKLDLKVDYTRLDLTREIQGSVDYINTRLAPPDRPARVFLWSGNCRPPPEALALVRRLGLENLNGGDTVITARNRTLTAVAARAMPWGDELQVYAPNQNENVYTNNWRGPLFGTFTHVLETFALTETPRRLKPVNIYYHFYSGDYPASLAALEAIHDWALARPLHAVSASTYARSVRDARATTVYRAGADRWLALNDGHARTFRLPAARAARLDLAASPGVTGWRIEGDQAYVHTDGSPVVTLTLAAAPVARPRLESSTGEITFHPREAAGLAFTVRAWRPVETVLAGYAPGAELAVSVNGKRQTARTDAEGRLPLALPAQAEVVVAPAAP